MPMPRNRRNDWITKLDFHSRLERWYRSTDEPTIGGGAHRRTAWVWVRDGHLLAKLQAATTREAVAEYLELVREEPRPIAWRIVASATGRKSKIVFGRDEVVIPNFHLYAEPETVAAHRL